MNSDSENFDSLKRLLALKRHEQPPPGYFNNFSRDVMARIKAGERGGEIGVFGELNWFQRLLGAFDTKPVFAGAFGAAVCALLISGIISSEQTPSASSVAIAAPAGPETSSVIEKAALSVNSPFEQSMMVSSTNPVAPSPASLFDQFQLKAQTVSFSTGGN